MSIYLCQSEDIPEGKAKSFTFRGKSIFAVKKRGQIFIYLNRCPHLGTELEWENDNFLDPAGHYIRCSTHGALFNIADGECLQGPCSGEHLGSIKHEQQNDQIFIIV